ncbi:MAG: alanine racemase [Clostridia bacterium]|nr:alanine racemase [Clostridia bacterium]MBQ4157677.1 alanine racemase [Clostridia bacterium]
MKRLEMQVSLGAIAHNARFIRSLIPEHVKMLSVVKADAYGHGAKEVASRLIREGLNDAFAVATADEGVQLRMNGITGVPIVVLGYSGKESVEDAVEYGLSQAVFDVRGLEMMRDAAEKLGKEAKAHLKIDTGMTRIGVRGKEKLNMLLECWDKIENVHMEGMFTHFSAADSDPEFTKMQFDAFSEAMKTVKAHGYTPVLHAAASTALWKNEYQLDMVRAGIALYGVENGPMKGALRFAQRLITRPSRIERVKKGDSVGYSRNYICPRDSVIMTLPCGYGDGYPRILSGKADVLVNGKRAGIVGNICMDMMMADVTDAGDVNMDSVVTLMGQDGPEAITPEELSLKANTIPYEIMLGFAPRIEKRIKDD